MNNELIKEIREGFNYTEDRAQALESLNNSLKLLSEDLYNKDFHFLYELIQNAEDNFYKEEEIPFLSFEVKEIDIEGESKISLIISNNELGFSDKNIRAICAVGKSTKNKLSDSIGEKGIGFKAVFKITNCPYIFSNGYSFKLPEKNPNNPINGLGYIVPFEIDEYPKGINKVYTTIVLPINKDIDADLVINQLLDINTNTILFLKKIQHLEIIIEQNGEEKKKKSIHKTKKGDIITLEVIDNLSKYEIKYFYQSNKFNKPPYIYHEKREGIESREIEIAIPIGINNNFFGMLFAYLPVWNDTGIPFMINSDFLLTSNREDIHTDFPWNKWLRDQISSAYVNSFVNFLNHKDISKEDKLMSYSSIPLSTRNEFLKTIIEKIHQFLRNEDVIFAENIDNLVAPVSVKIDNIGFISLLKKGEINLKEIYTNPLLSSEINRTLFSPQLEAIGVENLSIEKCIETYFNHTNWINEQTNEWIILLYDFLRKNNVSKENLLLMEILKLEGKSGLFAAKKNDFYFEIKKEFIEDTPDWLINDIKLNSLDTSLFNLIQNHEEKEELKVWLKNNLNFFDFNKINFGWDILNWLMDTNNEDSKQIIEGTQFIFTKLDEKSFHKTEFPLVLNNDEIIGSKSDNIIVIPETYNIESGWQHIWKRDEERVHFKYLSDKYSEEFVRFLVNNKKLGVKEYPAFNKKEVIGYPDIRRQINSVIYNEIRHRSAETRLADMKGSILKLPQSLLNEEFNQNKSQAIIGYLNTFEFKTSNYTEEIDDKSLQEAGILNTVIYYNRGESTYTFESSLSKFLKETNWLLSTSGKFIKPREVFIDKAEIKEIFGDRISYLEEGILAPKLAQYLGVKSSINKDNLIKYILKAKDNNLTDFQLIKKVYEQLQLRCNDDEIAELLQGNVVFNNNTQKWHKPSDCIWNEAKEIDNEFVFLSEIYDDSFKSFFLANLNVQETLSSQSYIEKWKSLQLSDAIIEIDIVDIIYKKLKKQIINKKDEDLNSFVADEALFYCEEKNKFLENGELYFADDKFLKEIFNNMDINFAYFPKKEGFKKWSLFFETVKVPHLSRKVKQKLKPLGNNNALDKNIFFTQGFVIILAAYIKTEYEPHYKILLENKVFESLLQTKEFLVKDKISITFEVGGIQTEDESSYYLDLLNERFYFTSQLDKLTLAKRINTYLNHFLTKQIDFSSNIENFLGAKDINRIEREGYTYPDDIYINTLKIEADTIESEFKTEEIDQKEVSIEDANVEQKESEAIVKDDNLNNKVEYTVSKNTNDKEFIDIENRIEPYREKSEIDKSDITNDDNKREDDNNLLSNGVKNKNSSKDNIPRYTNRTTEKRRKKTNATQKDNSTKEKLENEQKKHNKEKENLTEKTKFLSSKERLVENLENSKKFTFGWLKTLTELEYYRDIEEGNKGTYNITFNEIAKDKYRDGIIHLSNPDKYIPRRLEEHENLKLLLYTSEQIITLSIESISIRHYEILVRLYKSSDLKDIDLRKIEKTVIKLESTNFLWESLLDNLRDIKWDDNHKIIDHFPAEDKVEFIFGPPGTGKTTHLIENNIKDLLDKGGMKILVLAPTNKAADVLSEKLIQNKKIKHYYRFGNTGSEIVEKHNCYISKKMQSDYDNYALITTIARFPYDKILFEDEMPSQCISEIDWDYIIIDEASMINLAQISNVILTKNDSNFIISGDPFQIQPIVHIPEWKDLNIYNLVELNTFDQIKTRNNNYPITKLMTQYRSLNYIGNLYGEYCYNNKVKGNRGRLEIKEFNLIDNIALECLNIIKFPINDNSSIFKPKYLGVSSYHIHSALLTIEWLRYFVKQLVNNNHKTIGIISPYKAQSDLLFKLVNAYEYEFKNVDILVSTVHGFQGDECDIIIVVLNPPNTLNQNIALNNKNIINVAISRARDYLIFMIPENYSKIQEVKKIVKMVKNRANFNFVESYDLEKTLFNNKNYLVENTYSTAHHPINIYGNSEYKYEVRTEDDSIDIQIKIT